MRRAVFLDRDGTVIEHVHHLTSPDQVRLLNGAAEAIRRLQTADYVCVIVTNQSVIGRGLLTVDGLEAVHAEMNRQFADEDVRIDGIYFCPIAPTAADDRRTVDHPDRKPGPGMLLRAADELGLDLAQSWMIGDMLSDILAGKNAGCRGTILVQTGADSDAAAVIEADYVAASLMDAAEHIFQSREQISARAVTKGN